MTMDTDDALSQLGNWGRWQMIMYLILSVSATFPASWQMLAVVFVGLEPSHRCVLPAGHTNESTPPGKTGKCMIYTDISVDNTTEKCPEGVEYYDSPPHSIVTQWDLVCDEAYKVSTSQSVLVIGVMVGAMACTILSDNFGRKPVFLISNWAMVVLGVTISFVDNYYLFCTMKFFIGAFQQGIILSGFVMACELFPAKFRTFAGTAIENFWALGMCSLALVAYLIRDWRYFHVAISLPGIVTITYFWIIPESIPWLVANNRTKDAEEILTKAAKFNRVTLPDRLFTSHENDKLVNGEEKPSHEKKGFFSQFRKKKNTSKETDDEQAARYTLLDVLRSRTLTVYALIMCLLWFVNSLVYFGLSLSTAELAGNVYLNFFFGGLVEIPAYTLCIFILQKWGRRWPLAIFHLIAGVSIFVTTIIPKAPTPGAAAYVPLIIFFNMVGKFGITGSFCIVFLYAPEIFPTTLRSQAMGISSVGGRLGNMLAPFSSYVAKLVPWLPALLFGVLSIGGGLLVFLLPETLNRPLPQTIEDIEAWKIEDKKKKAKPNRRNEAKLEMVDIGNNVEKNAYDEKFQ